MKLALPFLDDNLIKYALTIPGKYKIKNGYKKFILRKTADELGVPKKYAWRKKIAAQYGSGIDKAIERIAKKNGFKYKSEYVKTLYTVRIGALISTGKDSLYALYRLMNKGYDIVCLITIVSENQHSYMFHTPTIELAETQAKAMGIPLIKMKTSGRKEEELKDLEKAIQKAIKRYKINGICTGALFSEYQKKRIDDICKRLGIKHYAPLWHMDQRNEMISLLKDGFKIIFTTVAAEGLDDSWLGRLITEEDIDELVRLHKRYNLNIAGEGGEYESLVLDAPMFKKRIVIIEQRKVKDKIIIERVGLFDKS